MRKTIAFILIALLFLPLAACGKQTQAGATSKSGGNGEEIPNPFIDCDTLADASAIAGFDVIVPETIGDYNEQTIRAIKDEMIDVVYHNGEKEICIRKAKGVDEISGVYSKYNEESTAKVKEVDVTMKGNNGNINVATWTNGDYSYAIISEEGIDKAKITEIVKPLIDDEQDGDDQ